MCALTSRETNELESAPTVNRAAKPTKQARSNATTLRAGRPLTARAVAELCGVELKTVHNWVLDGRLAHFRTPGRHLRFQPEVVAAFLEECGYATPAARTKPRVVCTAQRPGRGFRQTLAGFDCTWVSDAWRSLIELGRSGAEVWVVELAALSISELRAAIRAVRRSLPRVKIVVVADRTVALGPGVVCARPDDVARHVR